MFYFNAPYILYGFSTLRDCTTVTVDLVNSSINVKFIVYGFNYVHFESPEFFEVWWLLHDCTLKFLEIWWTLFLQLLSGCLVFCIFRHLIFICCCLSTELCLFFYGGLLRLKSVLLYDLRIVEQKEGLSRSF